MARVVKAGSSPPYLLIVMVFLFLIATTLAVLGYMSSDKRGKELAKIKDQRKKLADSADVSNPVIEKMMDRYDKPTSGERSKTVIAQFLSQTGELTKSIAGQETDAEIAIRDAQAAFAKIGSNRGLGTEALSLHTQVTQLNQQVAEKDKLLAAKQDELAKKDENLQNVSQKLQGEISSLQGQVIALDKKLSEQHDMYQSELDKARMEWQKQRDDLNKQFALRNQENQDLRIKNRDLENLVEKLKKQIQEATQPKMEGLQVGLRPDGQVLKVLGEENLCYIDLGSKDGVSVGLSFTVYPPTGIPQDGEGKATIVITNVAENTSECRAKDLDRTDPIVVGDLVANLAFDPTRTYTFVVEGSFDLYGTGEPTAEGAKQAMAMITRSGGKIVKEVDINTDFIVLGAKPEEPVRPSETAGAQEWQVYQERLAVASRYNQIMQLAQSMHIPVLNTNKFLAFVGQAR